MPKQKTHDLFTLPSVPLWGLDIEELTGHNIESSGRDEVNKMLQSGWVLLHVYTLRYRDEADGDGTWRERPMAILGKPKKKKIDLV